MDLSKKYFVKIGHSLSEAVAGVSEMTQRVVLTAMWMAMESKKPDVSVNIHDVISLAGGSKRTYDVAKSIDNQVRSMVFYLDEDSEREEFDTCGVVEGRIKYRKGQISLRFSQDAMDQMQDLRSKYTLVHLRNIRRLNGQTQVGLYLMLAAWDFTGECVLTSEIIQEKIKSKVAKKPGMFFKREIARFVDSMREKLGIVLDVKKDGRGKKMKIGFSWNPNDFRKAGGDDPELICIPLHDEDSEKYIRAEAMLRTQGVMDKSMPRRLKSVDPKTAIDIVTAAIDRGLTRGLLRDTVVTEITNYEEQNDREEIRKRNREAEIKTIFETTISNRRMTVTVEQWLATVDDQELLRTVAMLESHVVEHMATGVDLTNPDAVREAAAGNTFGHILYEEFSKQE